MSWRSDARRAVLLAGLTVLAACEDRPDSRIVDPNASVATVNVEASGAPLVTYRPENGKTTVVVQFVARSDDGLPLRPEETTVELLVDERPLDNESILSAQSEELAASIYVGLVLDASYSMLEHRPPAFRPMLQAARDAVVAGLDLYRDRPGTFYWSVCWFAEMINCQNDLGRVWTPDDILSIPEPTQGTSTKLFAAVESEAERMAEALGEIANGPRDRHIMVVFSDGFDNYSYFDNSTQFGNSTTSTGASYDIHGYPRATLASAVAAVRAHPKLTTFVIGLGSQVEDDELRSIAAAGDGRYFRNLRSSAVGALFEQVTREFVTIQNVGATIPLPPGDYRFTVRVHTLDRKDVDVITFRFHAGDDSAGVIE